MTRLTGALIAVSLLAATLAGCGPYVRSDVNTSLIGQVHCGTFAWAGEFRSSSPLRSTIANPLNESRLRAAIASHLGTVQPGPGNADCLVGYGIGSYYALSGGGYPYPYGWAWSYPYGWAGPGPYAYREGVIAVDLYDARTGQPLWHASAEQSLFGVSGEEAQKRIDSAVAAIFTKYPYRG
ncbi:MAG TPA: DUF4136 domain-containing protein [Steroidobacteraceae bacterium]|nr:DUF4136 domain-containing protein [Steroidobacteraceae bacterium]